MSRVSLGALSEARREAGWITNAECTDLFPGWIRTWEDDQ